MIKVEKVEVFNFEGAIRGMRNPLESHDKSDTTFELILRHGEEHAQVETKIGNNDLELMRKLYRAGTEHRKYLRQIFVSMDVTAPLYLWKELDQYKVGVVTDSCSTMHTITAEEFELDDFSHDGLEKLPQNEYNLALKSWNGTIRELNRYRKLYNETKSKEFWRMIIETLPSSYNQKRTVTMNYENVVTIIKQRSGHKLTEWNDFVVKLYQLPYIKDIMEGSKSEEKRDDKCCNRCGGTCSRKA